MQNLDAEKYITSVSIPNILQEEETELFNTLTSENSTEQQKDDAVAKICRSHIRFVSQFANYYCKRCPVDLEDMISCGVEGMMLAIEKFDVKYGCKFTTYCGCHIKLKMIRHIQNNCAVTIPQSVHDGLIQIKNAMEGFEGEADREELKDKLGITDKRMRNLEAAQAVQSISIHETSKDGNETSFLEDIIADNCDNPYQQYERGDLLECLREILLELDEKTLEIVMSNHHDEKVILEDLAKKYDVSCERIRQIRVQITKELKKKLLEMDRVRK
jgi:RNA polymerase sigma factor (sigma-70 family)